MNFIDVLSVFEGIVRRITHFLYNTGDIKIKYKISFPFNFVSFVEKLFLNLLKIWSFEGYFLGKLVLHRAKDLGFPF